MKLRSKEPLDNQNDIQSDQHNHKFQREVNFLL